MLAERLYELYQRNNTPDWHWFEDQLYYANALLPHGLILCGQWMNRGDMAQAGMEALRWLVAVQTLRAGGISLPSAATVSTRAAGTRACFDQQPIEAYCTVEACLEAWRMTRDPYWKEEARRAFDWFIGFNDLGVSIYDPSTGRLPRRPSIPIASTATRGPNRPWHSCCRWAEMRLAESIIARKRSRADVR